MHVKGNLKPAARQALDFLRRETMRESGFAGGLREIATTDPDLLAVLVETDTRFRHDEDFVQRMRTASADAGPDRSQWWEEQVASGALRTDVEWQQLARFSAVVMNGLAYLVASGSTNGVDLDAMVRLLEDALRPQN